jgi:hypothetical protein
MLSVDTSTLREWCNGRRFIMRNVRETRAGGYSLLLDCEVCGYIGTTAIEGEFSSQKEALASVPKQELHEWYLMDTELCPRCHRIGRSISNGQVFSVEVIERLKREYAASLDYLWRPGQRGQGDNRGRGGSRRT